jgi:predicted  nucleic acid-binding Zn-ribbon protein
MRDEEVSMDGVEHTCRRKTAKVAVAPARGDVRALLDLVALDEGLAKREASVAQSLAILDRTTSDLTRLTPELEAAREELHQLEQSGAAIPEVEKLRRALRGKERRVALVMRQAERKQADALAASADLRDACADLAERRTVLMSRIPGVALEIYAKALRLGRQPAAIGTHGAVCWGCFHRLPIAVTSEFQSEARLVPCPHCERLMYDPEWTEQP